MSDSVIRFDRLTTHFRVKNLRELLARARQGAGLRVRAVTELSFEVRRGEIMGFLGPNGAGKSTTIRTLMGLIHATSGAAYLMGEQVPARHARERVGFLPESPYFYDFLTATELCDLVGRLYGLDHSTRKRRAGELLDRVGLGDARARRLRTFSKGMLQRAGLAQALMNDPDVVVLDEPMSGLDPIGRKEVRDLIISLRDAGKTVFFSTHILSDLELICDRVAIIVAGKLRDVGPLSRLLSPKITHTEIVLRARDAEGASALAGAAGWTDVIGARTRVVEDEAFITLPEGADVDAYLACAHSHRAAVVSVTPRKESLEDLFLREVESAGVKGAGDRA